ncbi:O-antigen polymerase [Novipirellula artificiosorum]|uniref:O-antigen polymerase n=1 Tax=Novipirellula artificiosorum TaxID=2528016 RepID=UPI0018CEE7F2|nr:O-antigen polymerase [Novipirellula artificiosorum]
MIATKWLEGREANWLSPDALFTLSYTIVNFAYVFFWLSKSLERHTHIWNFKRAHCPETVCTATAMALACLATFLAGYYAIPTRLSPSRLFDAIDARTREKLCLLADWMLRIGFGGFLAFVAIIGPSVVFGSYKGTNVYGFIPNVFYLAGMVTLTSGLVLAIALRKRYNHRKGTFRSLLDILLVTISLIAMSIHGDRGTIVFILGGGIIAFNEYRSKIRVKHALLLCILAIIALGLIRARRFEGRTKNLGILSQAHSSFVNFGSSSVCNYLAVQHSPDRHGYYYGIMQFKALVGIVPFGRRLAGITDSVENSSSTLFTYLVYGHGSRTGTGTTMFADFYLNFGFPGTAVIFFIAGAFSQGIRNRSLASNSLRLHVSYVVFCSFLLIVPRYDFTSGFIRYYIYSMLYITLVSFYLKAPLLLSRFRIREQSRVVHIEN